MSLYQEALVEAKKLKEIAEADAKQAIIEEITPHIRKMIASSLANKSAPVLYEEEERADLPVDPAMGMADASAAPAVSSEPPIDASAVVGGPTDAPIQVAGGDALNMPMPGPDGKLVVDFDDLFVPSEPGEEPEGEEGPASAEVAPEVPGGMPSPAPVDVNPTPAGATSVDSLGDAGQAPTMDGAQEPELPPQEPQLETYELFSEEMDRTAKRIHKVYQSAGTPSLVKEALQDKLFQLLEKVETLTEKKLISENLSKILENRLEILHLKLQEAVSINTYEGTKGTDMASKSLKEFATKMLSESDTVEGGPVTSPADSFKTEKTMAVHNANDAAADKAGAHAKKVTEPTVTLKTEAAELAKLEEELKSLISESEGESLAADEGGQDLAGAASTIPNKKVGEVDVTKTPAGGPSNPASYVQGVSEAAVSAKGLNERSAKIKAENLRKQIAALQEQLKECGGAELEMEGSGLHAPGVPAKKSVMGEDDTVINFNFDLGELVDGLGDLNPDDEIEIVDDDEPSSDLGGASSDVSPMDLGSDDEDHGESDLGAFGSDTDEPSDLDTDDTEVEEPSKLPLSERVRRDRLAAKNRTLAENKALKTQLAEQTLFNAKVVHLQPFLNKNLTKEQKQKIVEYLDRGKTVEEVKTIYTRVKAVLESAQKAKAKVGSSSRPAGAGSASLNESANAENLYEGAVLVEGERNRLMELAGIRRR